MEGKSGRWVSSSVAKEDKWENISTVFSVIEKVFKSRNLDQNALKNEYFFEKL